jgi:hypothetical protein
MDNDRAKRALIDAVRAILRPLVRQLIAHGVTFPAFGRIAKEAYIDVATRHFALPFKKQTDSRVALVTGIPRKEIGQIRRGQVPAPSEAAQGSHGLAMNVLRRWRSDARYLDPERAPRELPYEDGGQVSFASLVDEIGGDIPPRAVLDELIRLGAVELLPDGSVRVAEAGYVPAREVEEKLRILGVDVAELIETIRHNIESPAGEALLQRKVYYDNVGALAVAEIRAKVRAAGGAFVQQMDETLAPYDRDRNPSAPDGPRKRVVVGVYYLDQDVETETESEE